LRVCWFHLASFFVHGSSFEGFRVPGFLFLPRVRIERDSKKILEEILERFQRDSREILERFSDAIFHEFLLQ